MRNIFNNGRGSRSNRGNDGNRPQRNANSNAYIDRLYNDLRDALRVRADVQREQKQLWDRIKSTHRDYSAEMIRIDKRIGSATHRVNGIISQLSHLNKTHRAMNLAFTYLCSEETRVQKIIESNKKMIRDVESGHQYLIRSTGIVDTNTASVRQYVKLKQDQLSKIRNWKKSIQRNMVR